MLARRLRLGLCLLAMWRPQPSIAQTPARCRRYRGACSACSSPRTLGERGPTDWRRCSTPLRGSDTLLRRLAVRGLGRFQRPELGRLLLPAAPRSGPRRARGGGQRDRAVAAAGAAAPRPTPDSTPLGTREAAVVLADALGARSPTRGGGRARPVAAAACRCPTPRRRARPRRRFVRGSRGSPTPGAGPRALHAGAGAPGHGQPHRLERGPAPGRGRRVARHGGAPARAAAPSPPRAGSTAPPRSAPCATATTRPAAWRSAAPARSPPGSARRAGRAGGRRSERHRPHRGVAAPRAWARGRPTAAPHPRRSRATASSTSRSLRWTRSAAAARTPPERPRSCAGWPATAGTRPRRPTIAGRCGAHALLALARLDTTGLGGLLRRLAGAERPEVEGVRRARRLLPRDISSPLYRLARDPDRNVQEAAITGLAATAGHEADSVYLRGLASSGHQVALAAAEALKSASRPRRGRQPARRARPAERAAGARTPGTRGSPCSTRIGELGSAADAARLEPYLADYDTTVAALAATTLSGWTARHGRPPTPLRSRSGRAARRRVPPGRRATPRHDGAVGRRRQLHRASSPREAPATVARVLRLVRSGWYDGKVFQRVEPNFVIQGGGPDANEYVGDRRLHARRAHPPRPTPAAPSASPPGAATPATGNGSSTWSTTRCWTTSTPSSAGSTTARKWRSTSSRATA